MPAKEKIEKIKKIINDKKKKTKKKKVKKTIKRHSSYNLNPNIQNQNQNIQSQNIQSQNIQRYIPNYNNQGGGFSSMPLQYQVLPSSTIIQNDVNHAVKNLSEDVGRLSKNIITVKDDFERLSKDDPRYSRDEARYSQSSNFKTPAKKISFMKLKHTRISMIYLN